LQSENPSPERSLSGFEHALTFSDEFAPLNIVGVVGLESAPKPELLRSALDALQERHPYLTVRIAKQGSGYCFKQPTPKIPLRMKRRENAEAWQVYAQEEVNVRMDTATGPLLRCLLLTDQVDPGESGRFAVAELIVTCHHAILDGVSLLALLRELLAHCAASMRGEQARRLPALTPNPPVEDLLPSRFRGLGLGLRTARFLLDQMVDEVRYQFASRKAPKAPINPKARCKLLVRQISASYISGLNKASRRRGITFNSVLGAALLMAVHKHLYAHQRTLLRGMTFADLRPYLIPPVSPRDLGCYVAMTRFSARLAADKPLWVLAEELAKETYQAARRGEKFIAGTMSKQMMSFILKHKRMRMAATALSFTGPVKLAPPEGPIRVTHIHGFVSNMVLGPQFTAQARLYQGNLVLDYLYLDSDMNQELAITIANEVETILINADSVKV